ncbi:macro domain-containing protein [Guggenheimella bovis]
MPFEIIRNEIDKLHVDAIVTKDFKLNEKNTTHSINVRMNGQTVEDFITSSYREALHLAKKLELESIAFFSEPSSRHMALKEMSSFLLENDMMIYLVVENKEDFSLSEDLYDSVSRYIEENFSETELQEEVILFDQQVSLKKALCAPKYFDNDDFTSLLDDLDAGFTETLLKLIDRTGKKDSEIYKKANVDRKLFSKIRNNPDYRPSKSTALAFAFALELDLEETEDFIRRAGYALSHSSKFDIIVEYFLMNRNYNVFELNEVLFAFDQPLIG